MNEKGIVLGKGFFGTKISKQLGYELIGKDKLDPSDFSSLEEYLDSENPDVIINAVAKTGKTNTDWCEENRGITLESNVLVPSNIARFCSDRKFFFVHLSSGGIYNGNNEGKGFSEEDKPNFYGPQFYIMTKIMAEEILMQYPCLILRPNLFISDEPHPRNLITRLAQYSSVTEEKNSMTVVPDMTNAMKELIKKRALGIYNVVNPGTISPAEIMGMYKEIVDPTHSFSIMSSKTLNEKIKTKRSNCFLSSDKLNEAGIFLPDIYSAVRDCMIKYKRNMNGHS